jgi:hypothetical protein
MNQTSASMVMILRTMVVMLSIIITTTTTAFTSIHGRRPFQIKSSVPSSTSSSLQQAAKSFTTKLSNPLQQLPWNVEKERQREIRRNQMERSKIFRQIGIAEDATYEEIVHATDQLILAAGNNLKQKIQIEIMKDQILQHRLNERLNGLLAQERNTNKEARAMSNYEMEGFVHFLVFSGVGGGCFLCVESTACVLFFSVTVVNSRNSWKYPPFLFTLFEKCVVVLMKMTYPRQLRNGMHHYGPKD